MTNTPGSKSVIVDSDALIGLIHTDDALHSRCLAIAQFLAENNITTIVPYPIVLEAATSLARAKTVRRPDLAARLLKDYSQSYARMEQDEKLTKLVASIYSPKTSKENTPFDHYIVALAKIKKVEIVFSFDAFYTRHGLKLAESLI